MNRPHDLRTALDRAVLERGRAQAATRALAEVGRALYVSLDPDVVARTAVDNVCRLLNVDVAVLFRVEPESGDFVSVAEAELNDWVCPDPADPRRPLGLFTVKAVHAAGRGES